MLSPRLSRMSVLELRKRVAKVNTFLLLHMMHLQIPYCLFMISV